MDCPTGHVWILRSSNGQRRPVCVKERMSYVTKITILSKNRKMGILNTRLYEKFSVLVAEALTLVLAAHP